MNNCLDLYELKSEKFKLYIFKSPLKNKSFAVGFTKVPGSLGVCQGGLDYCGSLWVTYTYGTSLMVILTGGCFTAESANGSRNRAVAA